MNGKITDLIRQIGELEEELKQALREQEAQFRETRTEVSRKLKLAQQQVRVGVLRWLRQSKPRNLLSAPIIYGMLLPMLLLDMALTLYQHTCFRLYRIPRLQRRDYWVVDRHHLAYLNAIEKFNCVYCAYANGLMAYAREITARTEQYWCPIKHASKVRDPHARYVCFLPYGEAEQYRLKRFKFRKALEKGDIPSFDDESR